MKLFVTTLVMLLLLSLNLQAEKPVPGVTGYGIKLGFGFATLSTSVSEFMDYDSYAGAIFGGFVTYSFSPQVSLQPELLFVGKGAGGSFLRGRSWRHNYLEVPVLLKYCLSYNSKLKPSLYLGPAVSFLLSSEFKGSFISDDIDTKDATKGIDLGIVLGGAVDYNRFVVDVRYTIGMSNVYDPAAWNQVLDANDPSDIYHMSADDYMKNRFLSFSLGYRF